MNYRTSQKGIELIKSFEGCRLTSYQDSVGVWTIGYGHTTGVYSNMKITDKQAESFLKADLKKAEKTVNEKVTYKISQNQFDALVSFTFNVGIGNFTSSTLLKNLNYGDITAAANEFDRWIHAGGKVLKGLIRRRLAEKEMFLKEIDDSESELADSTICILQNWLNDNYISELIVDGVYGTKTKKAMIKAYQAILGVTIDGVFGLESKEAVKTLKFGSQGNAVYLMQGMLYCRGFNPQGIDGKFGSKTEQTIKRFQISEELVVNGCGNPETMYVLFK